MSEARFKILAGPPSSGSTITASAAPLCPATSATSDADAASHSSGCTPGAIGVSVPVARSTRPRCQRPALVNDTTSRSRPALAQVAVARIHCGRPNSVSGGGVFSTGVTVVNGGTAR